MDVGENRVQEALGKYLDGAGTKKIAARFHLLGPLQSNKAKKAAQFFDLIQSLDRLELAADLQRHAEALGKTVRCLVEVKVSQESTKSGLPPERLEDFLSAMQKFSRVTVEGLMGIPPLAALGEKARPYFAQLKALHDRVKLPVLSMGMSSDFEIAIEEGATMVRVGTALFGSRSV